MSVYAWWKEEAECLLCSMNYKRVFSTASDLSILASFVHKRSLTFWVSFSLQEDQLGLSLLTVEQVESEEFQKRILQSAVAWFCERRYLTWENFLFKWRSVMAFMYLNTHTVSSWIQWYIVTAIDEAKRVKNREAFTYYSPTSLGQNMIIMRMKTRQDIFIQYYILHILQ